MFPLFARPKNLWYHDKNGNHNILNSNMLIMFIDEYNGFIIEGGLIPNYDVFKSPVSIFNYVEEDGEREYTFKIIDEENGRDYIDVELAMHEIYKLYKSFGKLVEQFTKMGYDLSQDFVYKDYYS